MRGVDQRTVGRAIVLIGHVETIEQRLVGVQRSGGVDQRPIVGQRADLLLHGVIGLFQRLLGDDIDDAARVDEAIENGPRPREQLHALDIGELPSADVVVPGILPKSVNIISRGQKAAHQYAAGGGEAAAALGSVHDGHVGEILHRLGQGGYLLVSQNLLADRLNVQRRIHDRRVHLGAGRGVGEHIALIVGVLRYPGAAVTLPIVGRPGTRRAAT